MYVFSTAIWYENSRVKIHVNNISLHHNLKSRAVKQLSKAKVPLLPTGLNWIFIIGSLMQKMFGWSVTLESDMRVLPGQLAWSISVIKANFLSPWRLPVRGNWGHLQELEHHHSYHSILLSLDTGVWLLSSEHQTVIIISLCISFSCMIYITPKHTRLLRLVRRFGNLDSRQPCSQPAQLLVPSCACPRL